MSLEKAAQAVADDVVAMIMRHEHDCPCLVCRNRRTHLAGLLVEFGRAVAVETFTSPEVFREAIGPGGLRGLPIVEVASGVLPPGIDAVMVPRRVKRRPDPDPLEVVILPAPSLEVTPLHTLEKIARAPVEELRPTRCDKHTFSPHDQRCTKCGCSVEELSSNDGFAVPQNPVHPVAVPYLREIVRGNKKPNDIPFNVEKHLVDMGLVEVLHQNTPRVMLRATEAGAAYIRNLPT